MRLGAALRGAVAVAMAVGAGVPAPAAAQAQGGSFEAVVKNAQPVDDLAMLAAPSVQDCEKARRAIDKARCRGVKSYLQARLGARRYVMVVDEPQVVSAAPYDAGVRGYRLRLVACLTCQEPVDGPDGDKRWVTLKVPSKGADSLVQGVELARPAVTFPNVEEAKTWLEQTKPLLRAEFVFTPTGSEWSFKKWRGVAFQHVASRVFNRCTGEVVYSDPPSRERAKPLGGEGCGGDATKSKEKGVVSTGPEGGAGPRLDSVTVNQVFASARADFEACDRQFKSKGTAFLDVLVPSAGGAPQKVSVVGKFNGTAVAQCLIDAAMKVKFPKPPGKSQRFQYPVVLKGE